MASGEGQTGYHLLEAETPRRSKLSAFVGEKQMPVPLPLGGGRNATPNASRYFPSPLVGEGREGGREATR
jgi:hypothetical protein